MRKVISLLTLLASLAFWIPTQAQFAPPPALPNISYATQTFTAGGNAVQNINGVGSATVEVTGTYSAVSFNLQCANNATFVNLPLNLVSGGPVTTLITGASTAANGLYYTNLIGCTKIKYLVNSITGTNIIVKITANASSSVEKYLENPLNSQDPCLDRTIKKQQVSVAIASATTTSLVATSGTTNVYPCAFYATVSGTNPTLQFKTGTQVTNPCDTGAASTTGVITPTTAATTVISLGEMAAGGAGNQFCVTTTGTPAVNGYFLYVQQ